MRAFISIYDALLAILSNYFKKKSQIDQYIDSDHVILQLEINWLHRSDASDPERRKEKTAGLMRQEREDVSHCVCESLWFIDLCVCVRACVCALVLPAWWGLTDACLHSAGPRFPYGDHTAIEQTLTDIQVAPAHHVSVSVSFQQNTAPELRWKEIHKALVH